MNIVAIIIARGGSKEIPKKNIMDFCGKPLIAWTIEACINGGIKNVWVSSDSDDILEVSSKYGAKLIRRPSEFAQDFSSSEVAWNHAICYLENKESKKIDWVFAPQVTSPFIEPKDVRLALSKIKNENYDSYFSCCPVDDLLIWRKSKDKMNSINYDWTNRRRRQENEKQFIENGAFYMFQPYFFLENKNRFAGNIGCVEMDNWKFFEIDETTDVIICEVLMKNFIIKK